MLTASPGGVLRTLLSVFAFWLAVAGAARAAAPLAVIPYEVSRDGAIMIGVTVDGRGPFPFIVDTGSTLTLVFENFAKTANLPPAEGPALRILSISGSRVFEPFRIGALSAGATLAADHVGVVLPDWEAPRQTPAGILGLDILARFTLALDREAGTIAFFEAGALPEEATARLRRAAMKRTRYDPSGAELFTVRGRVNGEPIDFIVDLGLATSLINYAAGDALFSGTLTVATGRTASTSTRLDDVFDDRTRVNAGVMRSVSVGSKRWSRKIVWIYDAPLFGELGVQRLPYGLLGADLLAAQDIILDFAAERIYFAR